MSTSVAPPANDAAPTEALELVHHHPGRLRVRAAALREEGGGGGGNEGELAARVKGALDGVPGITNVVHNPRTGSILVEYEPGLAEPAVIAERMATAAGLLSPFDPRGAKPVFKPASAVIDGTRELNAIAEELTGKRMDLRSLVPAALAGAAAYSLAFGKGPRLPRWDNLLWWSYSVFSALHAKEIHGTDGRDRAGDRAAPLDSGVDLP